MPVGTNLPKVGTYNRSVVLTTIQMAGGISRTEVAERTGLTPQTVSVIVRRLLEEHIVVEDGAQPSSGGKPRRRLRVSPAGGYAVGIHLDPAQVRCTVVDLTGRALASSSRDFGPMDAPEDVVASTARTVPRLLDEAGVPSGKVLGVGVACPGPIDQEEGMVISPPRQDRWTKVPIKSVFEAALHLPVTVDKDATASAVGERWAGAARQASNFAYIYLGAGVGGGVFVGNQVYRGAALNAGEFGHLLVDPRGPQCYCGRRGCVESLCRPAAMVEAARAKLAAGQQSVLRERWERDPEAVDHGALCAAALAGDRLARSVVDRVAGYLASAAVDVINILNPELIVIGGHAAVALGELYRSRIDEAVGEWSLARTVHRPKIVLSDIAADGAAIGAASLVLHVAFAPQLSLLLVE